MGPRILPATSRFLFAPRIPHSRPGRSASALPWEIRLPVDLIADSRVTPLRGLAEDRILAALDRRIDCRPIANAQQVLCPRKQFGFFSFDVGAEVLDVDPARPLHFLSRD